MESKFTKGPWVNENGFIDPVGRRRTIATVNLGFSENERKEFEANAKLIASAPELLEACQEVVKSWENAAKSFGMNALNKDKDYQKLKAAILKATSI